MYNEKIVHLQIIYRRSWFYVLKKEREGNIEQKTKYINKDQSNIVHGGVMVLIDRT